MLVQAKYSAHLLRLYGKSCELNKLLFRQFGHSDLGWLLGLFWCVIKFREGDEYLLSVEVFVIERSVGFVLLLDFPSFFFDQIAHLSDLLLFFISGFENREDEQHLRNLEVIDIEFVVKVVVFVILITGLQPRNEEVFYFLFIVFKFSD